MEKITQLEFVRDQILKTGRISRNFCLQNFITHLGSRIWDLRKEGFMFEVERDGHDYIYIATRIPAITHQEADLSPKTAPAVVLKTKGDKPEQSQMFSLSRQY